MTQDICNFLISIGRLHDLGYVAEAKLHKLN